MSLENHPNTERASYEKSAILEYLGNVDFKNAKVVFSQYIDEKSNIWNLNQHRHDYTEFIYILDGDMNISTPGKTEHFRLSQLIVYPKGLKHQEIVNMTKQQKILCIGIAAPEPVRLDFALDITDRDGRIRWVMEALNSEMRSNDRQSAKLRSLYTELLYRYLYRYYERAEHEKMDYLETCVSYIKNHVLEEITVEHLANICYLSKSHLTRVFKNSVNMTPMEYVRNCRLEIARRELLTNRCSIEEVAGRAGFKDAKYFSRYFRQKLGMTPREYRRTYRKDHSGQKDKEKLRV